MASVSDCDVVAVRRAGLVLPPAQALAHMCANILCAIRVYEATAPGAMNRLAEKIIAAFPAIYAQSDRTHAEAMVDIALPAQTEGARVRQVDAHDFTLSWMGVFPVYINARPEALANIGTNAGLLSDGDGAMLYTRALARIGGIPADPAMRDLTCIGAMREGGVDTDAQWWLRFCEGDVPLVLSRAEARLVCALFPAPYDESQAPTALWATVCDPAAVYGRARVYGAMCAALAAFQTPTATVPEIIRDAYACVPRFAGDQAVVFAGLRPGLNRVVHSTLTDVVHGPPSDAFVIVPWAGYSPEAVLRGAPVEVMRHAAPGTKIATNVLARFFMAAGSDALRAATAEFGMMARGQLLRAGALAHAALAMHVSGTPIIIAPEALVDAEGAKAYTQSVPTAETLFGTIRDELAELVETRQPGKSIRLEDVAGQHATVTVQGKFVSFVVPRVYPQQAHASLLYGNVKGDSGNAGVDIYATSIAEWVDAYCDLRA